MKKQGMKDLTSGSTMKLILGFVLPMMFGLLFQQFYSMVDTVVVGRFLGVDALAGVGSTGAVNFLVLGLCNGICAGFAIPVARKFGQKDFEGLRRFVGNMIWLSVGIAAVTTVITTSACRKILEWMQTPAETMEYAHDYIWIIFLGIPATMLYNLLSGIIRSLGDSKTPLLFLILSSLMNVALDILLIVVFKMGVAGAGWATVISQLVSGILCLVLMAFRFPILRLSRDDMKFRANYVHHLLAMGVPMGLQYSITAIGSILMQAAVNGLGTSAMAAVAAFSKVGGLSCCPFDAMGAAAATFAGQNLGAGKPERIHRGIRDFSILGIAYSLIILVVMYFFGGNIIQLFMDAKDPVAFSTVVPMSRQMLLTNLAFFIPLLYVNVLRFTIQGLGYSNLAMFAGLAELIARGVVALGLVPVFGFIAACLSNPAAWLLADAFLFPAYAMCMKRKGYPVWQLFHK